MNLDARQQAEFVGEITRYQASLRAFIISLMPGVGGVSDVLQETNLVLWEKREAFRPGTNFWAWACTIARYEVKNHRRKAMRFGTVTLDQELAEQLAEEAAKTPKEMDERMEFLEKCLGRLRDEERRLVEHRYFSGEPLENLSAQLGRSVESLRVTLFRVRAALRKCIKGELAINRNQT